MVSIWSGPKFCHVGMGFTDLLNCNSFVLLSDWLEFSTSLSVLFVEKDLILWSLGDDFK